MAMTITYGSLAFTSSALTLTIGPLTAISLFSPAFDMTPMGAGDTLNISVQRKEEGGTYTEVDNFTLSTPVAIAAAPGAGYIPTPELPFYKNPYGDIQFVCTYALGTGNSTYPTIYYDVTQGF